jgi:hypothetical protein
VKGVLQFFHLSNLVDGALPTQLGMVQVDELTVGERGIYWEKHHIMIG